MNYKLNDKELALIELIRKEINVKELRVVENPYLKQMYVKEQHFTLFNGKKFVISIIKGALTGKDPIDYFKGHGEVYSDEKYFEDVIRFSTSLEETLKQVLKEIKEFK